MAYISAAWEGLVFFFLECLVIKISAWSWILRSRIFSCSSPASRTSTNDVGFFHSEMVSLVDSSADEPLPCPPTHTFMRVKLTRENGANDLTSTGFRNGRMWCILLVIWQYLEASSTSDSHFLPVIFNQPFLPKIKGKTLVVRWSCVTMTAQPAAALPLSPPASERINSHVAASGTRCPPAHCPVLRNTASTASHSARPHLLQVSAAGQQSSETFL